ncbi:MAG: ArsR/SmtB family transcription factor [Acidimicrobiales bacterium]
MEAATFDVLAEPRRRQILDLLRERDQGVGALVDALSVSQPAVSKHLAVLRRAGLVESRVEGPQRIYRITAAPLRAVDEWLRPYRSLWASRLDALEEHLDAMDTEDAPAPAAPAGDPRPGDPRPDDPPGGDGGKDRGGRHDR